MQPGEVSSFGEENSGVPTEGGIRASPPTWRCKVDFPGAEGGGVLASSPLLLPSMLPRVVSHLSVTLQRANASLLQEMMHGANLPAPGGVLGHRLSDEPEFWRAVPAQQLEFMGNL